MPVDDIQYQRDIETMICDTHEKCNLELSKLSGLRIMHLNIRSLDKHFDKLVVTIDTFCKNFLEVTNTLLHSDSCIFLNYT